MFINKDSIIINGINMGQYIIQATYSYNKLHGSNSGRNLNGDMVSVLLGIYPKIVLQFRRLTKSELERIIPILDSPRQTTTYYDPYKKEMTTMTTYTGDYEIINKYITSDNFPNEGFSCSFIAVSKRR